MDRRKFIAMSGAATAVSLVGCMGSDNENRNESDEDGELEEATENGGRTEGDELLEGGVSDIEGLEILEYEFTEEDSSTRLEGIVVNNTGRDLDYVEVAIGLYNENGQRTGDSFTNIANLPNGEEWVFETRLSETITDIDEYRIVVVDRPLLFLSRFN